MVRMVAFQMDLQILKHEISVIHLPCEVFETCLTTLRQADSSDSLIPLTAAALHHSLWWHNIQSVVLHLNKLINYILGVYDWILCFINRMLFKYTAVPLTCLNDIQVLQPLTSLAETTKCGWNPPQGWWNLLLITHLNCKGMAELASVLCWY